MTRVLDRHVYRELLPLFLMGVGLFTFLHVVDRLQDFSNMAVHAPGHRGTIVDLLQAKPFVLWQVLG